jgi:hypothetical protein
MSVVLAESLLDNVLFAGSGVFEVFALPENFLRIVI